MMKIASIYNRKGGTGKSSLCFLAARYLAKAGRRTLAVDLDPQRTITNHFARLENLDGEKAKNKNAFTVLMEKDAIYEARQEIGDNLDLLPGSYDLSEIQSNLPVYAVRDALEHVLDEYDYCLLDNAPNWTALIQASLFAAGLVVIPTLPAAEDLEQAEWSLIRAAKVSRAERRIVLNQHNGERAGKRVRELMEYYGPVFNSFLLESWIPSSSLVRRYTGTGEELNQAAKNKADFMERFAGFMSESFETSIIPEAF